MSHTTQARSRGRPTLGQSRMVTVGIRIEPRERERLQELADECNLSLCAYLRAVVRRELARADKPALSACT
jgi:hypothetical protein